MLSWRRRAAARHEKRRLLASGADFRAPDFRVFTIRKLGFIMLMSRLGRVLEMGQRANPVLIMVRKSEDRDFTAFN